MHTCVYICTHMHSYAYICIHMLMPKPKSPRHFPRTLEWPCSSQPSHSKGGSYKHARLLGSASSRLTLKHKQGKGVLACMHACMHAYACMHITGSHLGTGPGPKGPQGGAIVPAVHPEGSSEFQGLGLNGVVVGISLRQGEALFSWGPFGWAWVRFVSCIWHGFTPCPCPCPRPCLWPWPCPWAAVHGQVFVHDFARGCTDLQALLPLRSFSMRHNCRSASMRACMHACMRHVFSNCVPPN